MCAPNPASSSSTHPSPAWAAGSGWSSAAPAAEQRAGNPYWATAALLVVLRRWERWVHHRAADACHGWDNGSGAATHWDRATLPSRAKQAGRFPRQAPLSHLHGRQAGKGRVPVRQLQQRDAKRPDVGARVVAAGIEGMGIGRRSSAVAAGVTRVLGTDPHALHRGALHLQHCGPAPMPH